MARSGLMTKEALPRHVAIIMDGNGRWAAKKHLPRFRGHMEGVNRVEEIAGVAQRMGIEVLTLFVFSTENWRRPREEVSMLMKMLCSVLGKKVRHLVKGNIRLNVIGTSEGLPGEVRRTLDAAIRATAQDTGLILNLAFNYGSRREIVSAVKNICRAVQGGRVAIDDINEESFSRELYTHSLPDPDLLIRTSGEQRISNFLLWQLSYAELYFTEKFWPDFGEQEFKKAIKEYQKRERRYGKLNSQE